MRSTSNTCARQERAHLYLYFTAEELAALRARQDKGAAQLTERRRIPAAGDQPELYEFHVDDCNSFTELRGKLQYGGMLKSGSAVCTPVKPSPGDWANTCKHKHEYDVCRCHLPTALMGQDE